jgi:hypothetical protein
MVTSTSAAERTVTRNTYETTVYGVACNGETVALPVRVDTKEVVQVYKDGRVKVTSDFAIRSTSRGVGLDTGAQYTVNLRDKQVAVFGPANELEQRFVRRYSLRGYGVPDLKVRFSFRYIVNADGTVTYTEWSFRSENCVAG